MMKLQTGVLFFTFFLVGSVLSRTTLERAFTAAYNERVFDGTWGRLFAEDNSGIFPSGACAGEWEYPEGPLVFEDLNQALGHGELRCGYVKNLTILNNRGHLLLDTTGTFAKGAIVQWYKAIAERIAEHYNTVFVVNWYLDYYSASEVLNAVAVGEYDSACGRFSYGGVMIHDLETIPRSYALSPTVCVTFYQEVTLWTRTFFSTVESFPELISSVNTAFNDKNAYYIVCVVGHANGGTAQLCSSVIRQYSEDKEYECQGTGDDSFPNLLTGSCDAVWGSAPRQGQRRNFNQFPAPLLASAGSFFRNDDLLAELRDEFDDPTTNN
mmetsp:Transcript_8502/g.11468  ORF Transcript_8502/g.11468 Transcript_8502/m.11468 type:complete len:325 (+) Transcript_8502:50-1024(+)|eukprot:CAMPEP_0201489492 /NCGR_PEP_ID=MMETSP0151_2-20130828/22834_1 /ASSEMBLY_ACC=CAM_ASM_000257 /TAXON_ID=200890 /ORGANISM="Paramoeba atlantica, Strain 621/1 / CCAP 1560/9" /LENGTH=324 /DNA_ID=CAMNT_0047875103 /DNA_START=46 /DNA_END=1020 /DNA_ORIENTATION=-